MTGPEMTKIRKMAGLGRRAFAAALGYTGSSETNFKAIMRYEMGRDQIPPLTARKVRQLEEELGAAKSSDFTD